jgi:SHS2 domain-containing protein
MGAVSDHSAVTGWEHFPHDADIGVRGYGATPGEACEQAALAMMATILDPGTVRLDDTVEVAVKRRASTCCSSTG